MPLDDVTEEAGDDRQLVGAPPVQDVVEQVDRLVPGRRQLGGGPGIGDDADLAPVRVVRSLLTNPARSSRSITPVTLPVVKPVSCASRPGVSGP